MVLDTVLHDRAKAYNVMRVLEAMMVVPTLVMGSGHVVLLWRKRITLWTLRI
jgi:L-asparaginase II